MGRGPSEALAAERVEVTLTIDEQAQALCAQVGAGDLWFPEKGQSNREAKSICAGCEIRERCLEVALANREPFGVWGGLNEKERRRLLSPRSPGAPREHGTARGYRQHTRHGEDPCDPCRVAHSAYQATYRAKRPSRGAVAA